MDNTDFAGNGDERAISRAIPKRLLRARTSSGKRRTSQARGTPVPIVVTPAKRSSRRKAGAEAKPQLMPTSCMPPQSSQPGGRRSRDIHIESAAGTSLSTGSERQSATEIHSQSALAPVIDEIREQWRRRQMWHRAEKSLTLQAKSMCRRLLAGDKKEAEVLYKSSLNGGKHELAATAYIAMHPLLEARKGIEDARAAVEKRLLVLAKQLPVVAFVENLRGFGLLSLAGIIGEAGDLGAYSNPAKLWKRMGLAVIGGERQRKKEGLAGIEHGYNPARRSLMWTIGDCIIRAGGELKVLYDQRKEYEAPRVKTKMHAHNRAKRYIEKRLLRDLWRAWR